MWHLLFAIALAPGRWYVCYDYDGKYNPASGPHATYQEAFASMRKLRGGTSKYGGEYR